MTVNRLIDQVTRELKRSPGKAAALGGGLLLAVWFWLPLLSEWFGGEQSTASVPAPAQAVPTQPALAAEGTPPGEPVAPIDWRGIVAWKQAGGYAQSYTWPAGVRDPFVPATPQEETQLAEAADAEPQPDEPLTAQMATQQIESQLTGLQLTSTLIMPRNRSATINGKVYREGESIELGAAGQQSNAAGGIPTASEAAGQVTPQVVVVRQVNAHSVMLQHAGQLYPIKLKRPTNSAIRLELR